MPVNKAHGSACVSQQDILHRWKEFCEFALNHPAAPPCSDLEDLAANAVPDPDTPVDAPALEEVCTAIRKMQNGRAALPDRIPPELLKHATVPVSKALHHLFDIVCSTGKDAPDNTLSPCIGMERGYFCCPVQGYELS